MVQKWDNIGFEIVISLIKGRKHLRKLSKELETPHTTLMRKLNALSKDNVIDSEKEGKNKVFFVRRNIQAQNYLKQAEQYKLSKVFRKYPRLTVILEEIIKTKTYRMIILFGSYAKLEAKETSDIDIYVETINKKTKSEIEQIYSKINVKIGNFNMNSDLMKEIIENHVILRGVDEFYEKIKFLE